MKDTRKRLDQLGTRLDLWTARVKALGAGSSAELRRSLESLREQWDRLREDVEAVELLGGAPGDDMMVAVETSLAELERAYAETEGKYELDRIE